jgi:3-hydroxyacyl-CoA dehydrogenase
VDKALEKFGFAMGPFRMGDLAGNDIGWASASAATSRSPDMRYSKFADLLCELGRYGQKTGKGWYDYKAGKRDAIPSPGRGDDCPAPQGAGHHAAQDQRRGDRRSAASIALVNEGARIARGRHRLQRASDIDMVYLTGYGFPLHRGGPMLYADTQWASTTWCGRMKPLCRPLDDAAFWQPAPLLAKLAAEGRKPFS